MVTWQMELRSRPPGAANNRMITESAVLRNLTATCRQMGEFDLCANQCCNIMQRHIIARLHSMRPHFMT
jgi:hypothetical protein